MFFIETQVSDKALWGSCFFFNKHYIRFCHIQYFRLCIFNFILWPLLVPLIVNPVIPTNAQHGYYHFDIVRVIVDSIGVFSCLDFLTAIR